MLKKMKIVIIVILALIVIVFLIRYMAQKASQDVNTFYKPFRENAKELFFNEINLADGEYWLYINHKDLGEFMVTDKNALLENRYTLRIKPSWRNYLPGEGNRSFGAKLYKDKKMIKSIQGGIFKEFEIGTLIVTAVPVKSAHFNGTKQEVLNKLTLLNKQGNVFITHQPTLPVNDKEFRFNILNSTNNCNTRSWFVAIAL